MSKHIKNFILLMVALVATTAFAACGDDDDAPGGTSVSGLKLTESTLTFTRQGGTLTFSAQAPTQVTATSDQAWCTVTPGTMSANLKVTPITVSVTPMTTETADRTATITVSAGSQSATVSVTQQSGDVLTLTTTAYEVGAEGGSIVVSLTANGDYSAQSSAPWLTVADKGSSNMTLSAEANSGGARQATVTLSLGQLTATLTVAQAAGKTGISAKATDIAKLMYPAWNLGNTMEPPSNSLNAETTWQSTRTSQQVIDYVKSLGFKAVRIPCSWHAHATNGQIDPAWTARVKEVVDYCINDGLYVMLNDHWDNGWIETDGFSDLSETNVSAKAEMLKTLWTQIATAFRDYDEHLLFAGLNEPNCDSQAKTDVLLRYEQAFIDAVRATGGNNATRILIVQGPSTDIDNTDSYYDISRLNDTAEGALMAEVHYYSPWNLCGMEKDESWGKMFFYWGSGNHLSGSQYNANWGEESYMLGQFQKMKRKLVDKGYPVILGEYGCQWRDVSTLSGEDQARHDASVRLFYKLVNEYAVNCGMVPTVWDINHCNQNGTRGMMTIVNRSQLTVWGTPAINGITEGIAAATWPQ